MGNESESVLLSFDHSENPKDPWAGNINPVKLYLLTRDSNIRASLIRSLKAILAYVETDFGVKPETLTGVDAETESYWCFNMEKQSPHSEMRAAVDRSTVILMEQEKLFGGS